MEFGVSFNKGPEQPSLCWHGFRKIDNQSQSWTSASQLALSPREHTCAEYLVIQADLLHEFTVLGSTF